VGTGKNTINCKATFVESHKNCKQRWSSNAVQYISHFLIFIYTRNLHLPVLVRFGMSQSLDLFMFFASARLYIDEG
jgi:hypothetical protein